MLIGGLAAVVLALAVAGPAAAEVKSVPPIGFEVATTATISALQRLKSYVEGISQTR